MAQVSGVYDEVPETAPYPFVTIGPFTEVAADAHGTQGLDVTVSVDVWTKAPGNGQGYDIFAAVDAALDRVPLAVAGWRDVSIAHMSHEALQDPDPLVRHISAQYRVWLTRV
jgi:hypothetical protein